MQPEGFWVGVRIRAQITDHPLREYRSGRILQPHEFFREFLPS
jgi:hypothetical protein